ncbi:MULTISPECIES: hypothetical protein [Streptosporangium]|uniref:Uncharacterized protein n=1 Tax=Streptosporangium brasiliense TaxID=47480 RepID=A0ABT9RKC1_9ACTN|nr:hypothetical protein [Streptosporangium brasiliense]MDP9869179.1 hypothetical protein [Streptosporangium brasiliense]
MRHLRHGFYWSVVMGGYASDFRAADRPALERFVPPPAGRSGLRLELYGRDTFSHGEPVVTEIKLSLDGSTPKPTPSPTSAPAATT